MCQLDVLVSFACYALNGQPRSKRADGDAEAGAYCRPKFDARATAVRAGRHPILDRHSPETLVSNDTVSGALGISNRALNPGCMFARRI